MIDKDSLPLDKPRRTPDHPTKSHVVKTRVDGKEKIIRFGEQGASTAGKPKEGESDRMKQKRASFKARHAKNIAKGKSSPAYWANKVKWKTGGAVGLEELDEKYEGIKKPDFSLLESFQDLIRTLQSKAADAGTQEFDPLRALGRSGAAGSLEDLYEAYSDEPRPHSARAEAGGNANPDRAKSARMVFDSFKAAGFSDAQARALTAEINRENVFNPVHLFGTHTDAANRATNVGMLSWQGDRADRLMSFMADRGLIDPAGRIVPGQDALNAQAEYLRWEMENDPSYARTRETFLSNPDIDPETAHDILGKNFIRWRIDDPKYRGSGFDRISEGYDILNMAQGFAEGGLAELTQKYAPGGKVEKDEDEEAYMARQMAAQMQALYDEDMAARGNVPRVRTESQEPSLLNIGGVGERLALLNQYLNPVEAIGGSMRAGRDMMAPDASGYERLEALGNMLSGVAGVAGPAAVAKRVGTPAATAVVEALTGASPTSEAVADMARKYAVDESGALRLYHNSPHDFDRFSMSQIGTGEGAQAYGHGLYFAESPSVSGRGGDYWRQFFNRMRSGPERTATGAMYANKFDPEKAASQLEANVRYHADRARPGRYGDGPEIEEGNRLLAEENQQALDMIRSGKIVGPRTYEVNVNANPEDFLDWDKLLSEQPEVARRIGYSDAALIAADRKKLYGQFSAPKSLEFEDLFGPLSAQEKAAAEQLSAMPEPWNQMTGKDAWFRASKRKYVVEGPDGRLGPGGNTYEEAMNVAGGDPNKVRTISDPAAPARAEFMREAGVPGIRYLDAGSRSAGDGSRNYVVFDENLINIVRKYGIAGAAAALGVSQADVAQAMQQGGASQYDPDAIEARASKAGKNEFAAGGAVKYDPSAVDRIINQLREVNRG